MKMNYPFKVRLTLALALAALLLASCAAPVAVRPTYTAVVPTPTTAQPTYTAVVPTPTGAAAVPTTTALAYTLDYSTVASDMQAETVPATPNTDDAPWFGRLPEHTLLTLQGYPVEHHLMQPQVFIYPIKELNVVNPESAKAVPSLQDLLAKTQVGRSLPFLPSYNAAQVFHAQVHFLDFKSGKGVRYITQFDQAVLPVNNHELIYTYQGITNDGKYYVAAVMSLNYRGLPDTETTIDQAPAQFKTDFGGYLAATVKQFDDSMPSSFTPDLEKLDAMMQSLEIQP